MYDVCMASTFSRVCISRVWLPILRLACGQLNMETLFFPCRLRSRLRIWPRETDSVVMSRVSLLILHTQQAESGIILIHGNPPAFRDGVHTYIPPTAIGSAPSFMRSHNNCVSMAFTAESLLAQGRH